jgi:hypothetical protein
MNDPKEIVKVVNKDVEVYQEDFGGRTITIEPNGYEKMRRKEAVRFLGNASLVDKRTGQPHVKNLEIVSFANKPTKKETVKVATEVKKFVCHFDGEEFDSQAELDTYLKNFEDQVAVDEAAEERLEDKKPKRRGK